MGLCTLMCCVSFLCVKFECIRVVEDLRISNEATRKFTLFYLDNDIRVDLYCLPNASPEGAK